MIAAPGRAATGPGAGDVAKKDACPRCGTAPGTPALLTSMTSYFACGNCAARWSVARSWLPSSIQRAG